MPSTGLTVGQAYPSADFCRKWGICWSVRVRRSLDSFALSCFCRQTGPVQANAAAPAMQTVCCILELDHVSKPFVEARWMPAAAGCPFQPRRLGTRPTPNAAPPPSPLPSSPEPAARWRTTALSDPPPQADSHYCSRDRSISLTPITNPRSDQGMRRISLGSVDISL